MALLYRLITDTDFQDALDKEKKIRVFQANQIIDNKAIIVRFDEQKIVTQASVVDITYHPRQTCEFFLLKANK